MYEDLNTAYKIAISACVLLFILSMGLSLMMIGRNFFNTTTTQITAPISAVEDKDAYYLASYGRPVPVADIWKVISRINYTATSGNGNFSSFRITQVNPRNSNDTILLSTRVSDLDKYMHYKAYVSWELNEVTGLYNMEVCLAT